MVSPKHLPLQDSRNITGEGAESLQEPECCGTLTSGLDIFFCTHSSCNYGHKSECDIPFRGKKGFTRSHYYLKIYRQLTVTGGERDVLFSGVQLISCLYSYK